MWIQSKKIYGTVVFFSALSDILIFKTLTKHQSNPPLDGAGNKFKSKLFPPDRIVKWLLFADKNLQRIRASTLYRILSIVLPRQANLSLTFFSIPLIFHFVFARWKGHWRGGGRQPPGGLYASSETPPVGVSPSNLNSCLEKKLDIDTSMLV